MDDSATNCETKKEERPSTEILLDTGSTCSVFNNKKMLINVKKAGRRLVANTNGGPHVCDMEGELPGFFKVWFNPQSMINILSFADVRKRFRITIDTEKESTFLVHIGRGRPLRFNEVASGLYLFDKSSYVKNQKASGYSFLTLAASTEGQFTKEEIDCAKRAVVLHRSLGFPGYQEFFRLLQRRYVIDCPITVDDAKLALHIYGPSSAMKKGKTTSKRPSPVTIEEKGKSRFATIDQGAAQEHHARIRFHVCERHYVPAFDFKEVQVQDS